ncbi:TetR/AcrR family transcriptional regulator [Robertmurraya andreesenii]|uniref:AcrR family transcriptional regulator n=1 Tax=Anoxybacillus andreesenii TaxID=1325932 RepID=A0ABT9UZ27_9BACL|nr:TetR/AcrR family transcriptional regulator [Robertmurraya andreesenii]MDQ0153934.1 AcrR family transcriptional regulator [Robertmurraya andreesenii]
MKEKITAVGISLFEKKGFTETSIQDIVDALGVTKGTFYYYFSSKEELLMDIHLQYIDDILAIQEKILADKNKDNKTKLFDIVYMLISHIKSKRSSAKIFFREMQNLSEERLEEIIPKRDRFRLNIENVVRDGIRKEEFRSNLNASIVTFGILGIANWSYNWFNPEGNLSDFEVSEIFVDMILRGIQ